METIKSYTSLEQSRKLAEILPLESADMHYGNFSPKGLGYENKFSAGLTSYIKEMKVYEELKEFYKIKNYNGIVVWKVIPCWSLAALLDIIPKCIKEVNVLRIDINNNNFSIWYDEIGFGVNNEPPDITADNPVDACYEMILKLNELKLL